VAVHVVLLLEAEELLPGQIIVLEEVAVLHFAFELD
jgi:hypothetical protein